MSTYQTRKPSVLDASRTQTNHSTVLNTTDISLNSTNLESYKKALHSIVRRLNKTPSSSSKNTIKKLEYKMNQTQQPLYNTNILTSSHSSKKHYMSPISTTKNHSMANRSQSGERSPYKVLKDGGDRSMQESYLRKESLTSNFMNSVSINKVDKLENTLTEELYEEKLKGDSVYVQDNTLNSTLLQDVNATKLETEGDQRLRELVHKYQLRDSAYRQELNQVKKAHEAMKGQMVELEREMDKVNKNKDMEKRYISKLEEENSQLKERLQQETVEKKALTAMLAENKESQYLKIIEDLKTQVSTLTSEKKLIEHLLKNALTQKEAAPTAATNGVSKDNIKDERKLSTGILTTLESSSLAINSCKYSNIKERVKTAPYAKKTAVTESFNDENDYATHAHYQTMNSSFGTVPLKFDKEAVGLKELKQPQQQQSNSSVHFDNLKQFLNERINTQVDEQPSEVMEDEGDEAFPNKVFHPKLNEKSLKERINLSQFKLDLTRISKSRKVE